jgi:hypothetical protein
MHLRDLLDEVAASGEPPSRLTARDVYAAGRRRRRTTATVRWGAGTAFGVALVVALVTVTAPPRAPDNAGPVAGGPVIQAIGGYDRQHLYAIVQTCDNCEPELRATSDGGRTWVTRGTIADVNLTGPPYAIDASRAGTVGVSGYLSRDGVPTRLFSTSIDRGRSFAQIMPGGEVDSAPPDALVVCAQRPSGERCVVQAVDLDAGTSAALATQPDPVVVNVTRAPDGAIWALGRDDGARRPAVARSTDGGRTWSTHVFTDAPEFSAEHRLLAGDVAAVDGTVVVELTYAPLDDPAANSNVAFRLEAGAWRRLDTDVFGGGAMAMGASFLAADGTFLLQQVLVPADLSGPSTPEPSWNPSGPPWTPGPAVPLSTQPAPAATAGAHRIRFWSNAPGEATYRPIDAPPGLAGDVLTDVVRLPGGGYLARSGFNAWVSDDGWYWIQLTIR